MIKFNKIETNSDSAIYIAYYDQNSELSTANLSNEELVELSAIKATARQREYVVTRLLLNSILPNERIVYSQMRAPMLQSGSKQISISHSSKAVAIMVSSEVCGLDIELIERNFERISSKFLTPNDLVITDHLELAAVWSAKEAIYKYFGGEVKYFEDAVVESIDDKSIICMVLDSRIEAKIVLHGDHIVVYCDKFPFI